MTCTVLAVQVFLSSVQAADPIRGKQLYESRCIACHSIDDNRAGPAHKGVFGRKAGLAKGFDYSPAVIFSIMDGMCSMAHCSSAREASSKIENFASA